MNCSSCGKSIRSNSRFCVHCGSPVDPAAENTTSPDAGAPETAVVPGGESARGGGRRRWLMPVLLALGVIVATAVGIMLFREPGSTEEASDQSGTLVSDEPGSEDLAATAEVTTTTTADRTTASEAANSTTSSTATTTTAPPQPIELDLSNATATATAVRSSVILRCDRDAGLNTRTYYTADLLIDGDLNTGWGAGQDDGEGHSVTIDFGQEVVLTTVGLTPGFAKVGPRADTNCQDAEAFPHNAFVARVSYAFDDGSSVVQQFEQRKDLQTLDLVVELGDSVRTQFVTITILETVFPPGADVDTILSEAKFWGNWGFA